MQNFFENALASLNESAHGSLDVEQAKREFPLVQLEFCDPVQMDVANENYLLSQAKLEAAIRKLRNARIFPIYQPFPHRELADPGITPYQFTVHPADRQDYPDEYSAINAGRTVPGYYAEYDKNTRSFEFLGTQIHVSEQIHQQIEQGLKIYVWQNCAGTICWLPSYLAENLTRYLHSEFLFEHNKKQAYALIQQAEQLKPQPRTGLLNALGFEVVGTYKINMRMLHERGWGTGQKRNTVVHLGRVQGELADYRDLEEVANQSEPLCGSPAKFDYGSMDHIVNFQASEWQDTGISCPRCIAAAKRLLKQQAETTQLSKMTT